MVGGLLWWRLASLIRCQGPDRAAHTAIKTCFDEADADVPAAATGVPAGSERSSCVAVHATQPTERRRVQTRRPARHLTSKLHPYAATIPLPQASPGSRADQCWRIWCFSETWAGVSLGMLIITAQSSCIASLADSRYKTRHQAAYHTPGHPASNAARYKSARSSGACKIRKSALPGLTSCARRSQGSALRKSRNQKSRPPRKNKRTWPRS